MEDRYLFKCKRLDNGEWVEGCLLALDDETYRIATSCLQGNEEHLLQVCAYEVDPSTICQCTGLKDKNGKLIWENDVIKYHFGDVYAPIKYGEYQSCFDSASTGHIGFYVDWRGTKKENMRKDLGYWINMISAEVVGNIFDNPELLEVKE